MTWEEIISNEKALIQAAFFNNQTAVIENYEDYRGFTGFSGDQVLASLEKMTVTGYYDWTSLIEVPWLYGTNQEVDEKIDSYSPIQKSLVSAAYNYSKTDTRLKTEFFQTSNNALAVTAFFVGMVIVYVWTKKSKSN